MPGAVEAVEAEGGTGRFDNGLPAGATAQVGQQGRLDRLARDGSVPLLERRQAEQDARGAESALAGAGIGERPGPAGPELRIEPLHGGHGSAGHPPDRSDAGDAGGAVDPDGAAAALALGAAPVLDRTAADLLAERVEQRGSEIVLDRDGVSVEAEGDGGRRGGVLQLIS